MSESKPLLRGKTIRLKPAPDQEALFWKSAGTARWAYNYYLAENKKAYQAHLDRNCTGPSYVKEQDVRKYINNVLKKTTHTWLSEVGSNVVKQAVKDADDARKKWLKGERGKPKFKSRHKSRISFYVNYESLSRRDGGFHGEKIGFVRTAEPLPKLPKGVKYSNPRIWYDGRFWYLSVAYPAERKNAELTGESLGIDLGVKDLAICSNGQTYRNINKSKRVRKLKKRLRREQRKLSRMMEGNISGYTGKRKPIFRRPLRECCNIQRQVNKVRTVYKHIADIRHNYTHQTTNSIVKTWPSRIVMEHLNVRGMMKNRYLAEAIGEQGFREFVRQIKYKAEQYGIEVVQADRWYPSSKTCSCCGSIKKDLKLSDRVYRCEACGLVIDRDYNASINLSRYQSA